MDLRKPKDEKRGPKKHELDNFTIKPGVKITALAISGITLAGLVAYFLMSKNYLASLLFALAGITLVISIFLNKNRAVATPRKIKHTGAESLMDIFAKILGL